MKPLDLNFICQTLGLPMPSENQPVSRIVTDSRDIQEGDVFFALAGERFDAHDFVEDVLAAGATAVVVSREDCAASKGALKVDDTLAALQKLAKAWRENVNPFVFGITGSSGHRYAVIEMGMNHFGELSLLTRIAGPNVALVNNALRAHVGCGFNGVCDIAKAKSEIYEGLLADGIALIPCEDANIATFEAATAQLNAQTFGVASGDVHAENIELKPLSCEFDLVRGNERVAVVLPVPGRHNVHNAVAAAALALAAGLSLAEVSDGLKNFSNIKGRLNIKQGIKDATLIDDTYNANPDSMKAAIDVLAAMPAPRIFVMGDMGELGEDEAAAMHAEVGAYARDKGIEAAYFVGDNSVEAAETFGAEGLWFADKDPLIQVLSHDLPERATVLVKGSRFMKMEEVVEALATTTA